MDLFLEHNRHISLKNYYKNIYSTKRFILNILSFFKCLLILNPEKNKMSYNLSLRFLIKN